MAQLDAVKLINNLMQYLIVDYTLCRYFFCNQYEFDPAIRRNTD